MHRASRGHVSLIAVLLAASIGCSAGTAQDAGPPATVPDRGLFRTSVAHFDDVLRSERERPTVVNVWASWCIPCRREIPVFRDAVARHPGSVRFVGLNVQDAEDAARDFARELEIPFPSGRDVDGRVMRHLEVRGLPTTFFYRPGGKLAFVHSGEIDAEQLERRLKELLLVSGAEARR